MNSTICVLTEEKKRLHRYIRTFKKTIFTSWDSYYKAISDFHFITKVLKYAESIKGDYE